MEGPPLAGQGDFIRLESPIASPHWLLPKVTATDRSGSMWFQKCQTSNYIEISFTLQHDAVSRILRSEGMPPLEFNNGSKTCQGYIPMWSNLLADRILPRVGPLAIYRHICDGVWRWVLAPGGFCCLSPVIALVTVVLATRVIWSQRAVCSRL